MKSLKANYPRGPNAQSNPLLKRKNLKVELQEEKVQLKILHFLNQ